MPLIVVAGLAAACVPEVVDEAGSKRSDNLEGRQGSGASDPGTEPPELQTAVAMTRAQLDVLWDEYWDEQGEPGTSSSSSGGGGALDPNDLFIQISDMGASCGSPTVELSCGGHWSLSLALPPAYQAVGIYDLEDPQLAQYSSMSETGEPYSPAPDDCGWGGGSLGSGTLEVVSIDEQSIEIVVTMDQSFWNVDPSGTYTASLCAP